MPVPVPTWGLSRRRTRSAWCDRCGWCGPSRELLPSKHQEGTCPKCGYEAVEVGTSMQVNVLGWIWLLFHPRKRKDAK